jgi:hypothetical protein
MGSIAPPGHEVYKRQFGILFGHGHKHLSGLLLWEPLYFPEQYHRISNLLQNDDRSPAAHAATFVSLGEPLYFQER